MITGYLRSIGPRRIMIMSLGDCFGISFARFLVIANVLLFIVEFLFGKKYIGIGTPANALFNGYIATFFYNLELDWFGLPQHFWQQAAIACLGVVVCGLGVSMYQRPDTGAAPYDSLALILSERCRKIPYFWHRIFTDAVCTLVCWRTGGIVGLGTVLCAFGYGPFIHFFNEHLTDPLLNYSRKKKQ